jgi:hypothetical protein
MSFSKDDAAATVRPCQIVDDLRVDVTTGTIHRKTGTTVRDFANLTTHALAATLRWMFCVPLDLPF